MQKFDDLICVGQLKSAYGIKGWIWLYSNTEPMSQIFEYSPLLYKKNQDLCVLSVEKWRKQGKGLVAKLDISENRNDAESLVGTQIYLRKEDLPQLPANEYYWSELVGMLVYNNKEVCLGEVASIFETAAHPILEVVPAENSVDNEQRLIPWDASIIIDIDQSTQIIKVDWGEDF